MVLTVAGPAEPEFLMIQMPVLLNRFSFEYEQDDSCVEYFLYSKDTARQISKTLIVSHDLFSGSLYVSKFYPEINKEVHCKYLSAACFYMMAHHAVKLFHLADNCCVNLETDAGVFEKFYSRLDDFHFKINYTRPTDRVCLKGRYHKLPLGTGMIHRHGSAGG